MSEPTPRSLRIPTTLNVALVVVSSALMLLCVTRASSAPTVWSALPWAVAFSFVANTNFSLLHEAVHGVLHPWRKANEALGIWCAALFPTGFSFQRLCHLSHHANNRTDAEMFDMYYPTDRRWLKVLQFYSIFTGPYWFLPPLGSLAALLVPSLFLHRTFRAKDHPLIGPTGLGAMVRTVSAGAQTTRLRLEILATVAVQVSAFLLLDWTFTGYLVCALAFSLNWGALQYADHAWSERDVRDGAWNLKVSPVARWIFLNYHHHLAHHQHPNVPWVHLGRFVDPVEPRPTFWSIYLKMWGGPTPAAAPPPRPASEQFSKLLWEPLTESATFAEETG